MTSARAALKAHVLELREQLITAEEPAKRAQLISELESELHVLVASMSKPEADEVLDTLQFDRALMACTGGEGKPFETVVLAMRKKATAQANRSGMSAHVASTPPGARRAALIVHWVLVALLAVPLFGAMKWLGTGVAINGDPDLFYEIITVLFGGYVVVTTLIVRSMARSIVGPFIVHAGGLILELWAVVTLFSLGPGG